MKTTTQNFDQLYKTAQFSPVFSPDGTIVGLQQLKIDTDLTAGIAAMESLARTYQSGDEQVLANGWTAKQLRILNTPAPGAAHLLKPSQKYDAKIGELVPSLTIQLHHEVIWRLFEELFLGQYSVDIQSLDTESEDVLPNPNAGRQEQTGQPDSVPGRIFYSKARVVITLHLKNGQSLKFAGLGVAYDHVRQTKVGNVFAINSAHRTVEKGAISDAKREAISNIGRVFRRAFEDGDEMMQRFEEEMIKLLQANNTEQATAAPVEKIAPPKARRKVEQKPQQDLTSPPVDEIPFDDFKDHDLQMASHNKAPDNTSDANADNQSTTEQGPFVITKTGQVLATLTDADVAFDTIGDLISDAGSLEDALSVLTENTPALHAAEKVSKSGNSISSLKQMIEDAFDSSETADLPDSAPSDNEGQDQEIPNSEGNWLVVVEKPTGAAILEAYRKLFTKANSAAQIDDILNVNSAAARRLTKAQLSILMKEVLSAKKSK